jgi:organic radical activating enzyme
MKIYNTSDPFVINWDLNSLCTYNCSYCPSYLHLGNNFIYGKEEDVGIIEDFCNNLNSQISERNVHIFLNGGEPTIAPSFETIINFGHKVGWKIYVNTNASRSMRWWHENVSKIFGVNVSYHPEEAPDSIIEKIDYMQDKTNLSVFVLMYPLLWEKAIDMYNKLLSIKNIRVSARRVFKRESNQIADSYSYNKSQKKWLFDHSDVRIAENIYKNTGFGQVIYENKGKEEIIDPVEWVNTRKNSFKGWDCNIGVDYINIIFNGDVQTATCNSRKKISTIKEFTVLPTTSTICKETLCMCTAEVQVPKHRH